MVADRKWGEGKPKQYLVFDEVGYIGPGSVSESLIEGEGALVEFLEEHGEDYPSDVKDYKVFEVTPVCFEVTQPQELEIVLKLDC